MARIISAAAVAVGLWAGAIGASAEMVDIGTGRMDRDALRALTAMVQGGRTDAPPTVSTPPRVTARYGPVEMTPTVFEALRRMVAGTAIDRAAPSISPPRARTVDIGTGRMPLDDFLALKRMVRQLPHGLGIPEMAASTH